MSDQAEALATIEAPPTPSQPIVRVEYFERGENNIARLWPLLPDGDRDVKESVRYRATFTFEFQGRGPQGPVIHKTAVRHTFKAESLDAAFDMLPKLRDELEAEELEKLNQQSRPPLLSQIPRDVRRKLKLH